MKRLKALLRRMWTKLRGRNDGHDTQDSSDNTVDIASAQDDVNAESADIQPEQQDDTQDPAVSRAALSHQKSEFVIIKIDDIAAITPPALNKSSVGHHHH